VSKKAQKKIKKPDGILYFLVYILIYPVLKIFYRLAADRKSYKPPKGPFAVICNHVSFMDFLLVMLTIYPRRLNAVAAQKFYFYSPLHKLLPFMGCIPKNLFDPDIRSIIGMKTVLKRGGRVLLFPEGRCTVHGPYMGIHKTTGNLLKNLGVPVISCYIEGAYTCMPFWRKGAKFGRTRVTLANLFAAEDLRDMTPDEINAAVDRRLGGADTAPFPKPFCVFRAKRLLEGLENIIYYCPDCGGEFTLKTKNNTVYCEKCGSSAVMDRYAALKPANERSAVPKSVQAWYKAQAAYEMRSLKEGMEPIKTRAKVRTRADKPGKGLKESGFGTLTLDPSGWRYEGALDGEDVNLFFPLESVPALPFDPNDNFQIYSGGTFYAFTPENARACSKYATIGECMYQRFSAASQMTPGYDSGFII